MTYPLGRSVIPQILVRRERWSGRDKVLSVPLVLAGQEVLPDQPVLRLASEDQALNDSLRAHSALTSAGSEGSPQLSETIPAGLHGHVVTITDRGGVVIESRVALVQGILGAGNPVAGVLAIWQAPSADNRPLTVPPGAILVVPGSLTFALLRQAVHSGVVGIVASSISLRDLEGFLRADFIQLIDATDPEQAQGQLPPLTLCLTEGLGATIMSAPVLNILRSYQGSIALLSGITSTRQHIFPEVVISLPVEQAQEQWLPTPLDATLALGAQVRINSGEHAGTLGLIDYFFVHEQSLQSGVRARAVRLRLENGSFCVVPLTLIERIG